MTLWSRDETMVLLESYQHTGFKHLEELLPGRSEMAIRSRLNTIGARHGKITVDQVDQVMSAKDREPAFWGLDLTHCATIPCMCCRQPFFSWHRRMNRLCDRCGAPGYDPWDDLA